MRVSESGGHFPQFAAAPRHRRSAAPNRMTKIRWQHNGPRKLVLFGAQVDIACVVHGMQLNGPEDLFRNASTCKPRLYSSKVITKGRLDVCRMCRISIVSPRTR